MLDDVDFETACTYANKIDGCNAYRKTSGLNSATGIGRSVYE